MNIVILETGESKRLQLIDPVTGFDQIFGFIRCTGVQVWPISKFKRMESVVSTEQRLNDMVFEIAAQARRNAGLSQLSYPMTRLVRVFF